MFGENPRQGFSLSCSPVMAARLKQIVLWSGLSPAIAYTTPSKNSCLVSELRSNLKYSSELTTGRYSCGRAIVELADSLVTLIANLILYGIRNPSSDSALRNCGGRSRRQLSACRQNVAAAWFSHERMNAFRFENLTERFNA